MVVSHSKKFIFFHIYKVAGSSIRHAVNKYACKKTFDNSRDDGGSHIRPAQLKGRVFNGYKGESLLRDYFKFAFVRNPWDWQVSYYFYIKSRKHHHLHDTLKDTTFEEYLEWKINAIPTPVHRGFTSQPPPGLSSTDWALMQPRNKIPKNVKAKAGNLLWRRQPQYMFLSENLDIESPIHLDFVGKYEYLDSDFSKICDILDLDQSLKLGHRNKTKSEEYSSRQGPLGPNPKWGGTNHYTEYYTDKTRKMVEDAYRVDIDYFGYDFNNEKIVSGEEIYLNKNKSCH